MATDFHRSIVVLTCVLGVKSDRPGLELDIRDGQLLAARGRRLSLAVPEASSSLSKQLRVPRREGLRQLLFKLSAKVPQRPRLGLVRYGELVRIAEATDELEEHKGLIGTQLKVNRLLRVLIYARTIADWPKAAPRKRQQPPHADKHAPRLEPRSIGTGQARLEGSGSSFVRATQRTRPCAPFADGRGA